MNRAIDESHLALYKDISLGIAVFATTCEIAASPAPLSAKIADSNVGAIPEHPGRFEVDGRQLESLK